MNFGASQFSSVAQSCLTICYPMNRSTPGLPVHHQFLEFTQTHVYQSVMPSSHLILCRPLLLLPPVPPSIRLFSMSQLFTLAGVTYATKLGPLIHKPRHNTNKLVAEMGRHTLQNWVHWLAEVCWFFVSIAKCWGRQCSFREFWRG